MKCPLKPMPADRFFDPKILKIGAKFEREHTNSDKVAKEIVKGHILEFPKSEHGKLTTEYYKHLTKMEKRLEQK